MIALFFAALFGYYVNRICTVERSETFFALRLQTRMLFTDVAVSMRAITFVCAWIVFAGRATRDYWNFTLIPWSRGYGLLLPQVPVLVLPPIPKAGEIMGHVVTADRAMQRVV
jgi:hypothetical protein